MFAGASYDGLVALEAAAHDHTLLTLDERAQQTYGRLGVRRFACLGDRQPLPTVVVTETEVTGGGV